jgi:hypothetical protein
VSAITLASKSFENCQLRPRSRYDTQRAATALSCERATAARFENAFLGLRDFCGREAVTLARCSSSRKACSARAAFWGATMAATVQLASRWRLPMARLEPAL